MFLKTLGFLETHVFFKTSGWFPAIRKKTYYFPWPIRKKEWFLPAQWKNSGFFKNPRFLKTRGFWKLKVFENSRILKTQGFWKLKIFENSRFLKTLGFSETQGFSKLHVLGNSNLFKTLGFFRNWRFFKTPCLVKL